MSINHWQLLTLKTFLRPLIDTPTGNSGSSSTSSSGPVVTVFNSWARYNWHKSISIQDGWKTNTSCLGQLPNENQLTKNNEKMYNTYNYGGSMTEWFRVLDLKSGGPWFKSSTLHGRYLGSTPRPHCINSQLVSLPPVGILNSLCSICNICLLIYSVSN